MNEMRTPTPDRLTATELIQQAHKELAAFSVPCTSTTSGNHAKGEEAAQVKVTLTEICTGEACNQQTFHAEIIQDLTRETVQHLRVDQTLTGDVQATIIRAWIIDLRLIITWLISATVVADSFPFCLPLDSRPHSASTPPDSRAASRVVGYAPCVHETGGVKLLFSRAGSEGQCYHQNTIRRPVCCFMP